MGEFAAVASSRENKFRHKIPNSQSGGGGIRTHESFRPAGFQDRCLQPLGHPSGGGTVADPGRRRTSADGYAALASRGAPVQRSHGPAAALPWARCANQYAMRAFNPL